MNTNKRFKTKFASSSALIAALLVPSTTVLSQEDDDIFELAAFEVTATGTVIRGVEPIGAKAVVTSQEDILEAGTPSSNQVLSQIPQITSAFNEVVTLPTLDTGVSIVRPNIRNLGAAGGTTTLVLFDGHKAVGSGILLTVPDPDIIPASALQRVDVLLDGGSSIYGADAVGGVINFVTKDRFDGVQLDARYGSADSYYNYDTTLTAGKDWGDGGAYISYTYAKNDAILGQDRDYIRNPGNPTIAGNPGNITIDGTSYALRALVPGTQNTYDDLDLTAMVPGMERYSLFGVFNQKLSDTINLDVRGFHSKREMNLAQDTSDAGNRISGEVTPDNPYYNSSIADTDPGVQSVDFSFGDINQINTLRSSGITATLTTDLTNEWQLRTLLNYGESEANLEQEQIDTGAAYSALAADSLANALNPYDPFSSETSVLDNIIWDRSSTGKQTLKNVRLVADGPIGKISNNEIRLAFGYEYSEEDLNVGFDVSKTNRQVRTPKRDINAAFAEIAVPLLDNLDLSGSIRYDDYSDVGSTTNPRLGINFRPSESLTLRASTGSSFVAPSLADIDAPDTRAVYINGSPFRAGGDDAFANDPQIILAGGNKNLKPQEADTQSFGFDFTPAAAEGLTISATYYKIDMTDQISVIPFTSPNAYSSTYSEFVYKFPDEATTRAIVAGLPADGSFTNVDDFLAAGPTYSILDVRRQNLSSVIQDGIDFNVNYEFETDFGSMSTTFGGTHTLGRDVAAAEGLPFTDALDDPGLSATSLYASVAAKAGNLYSSLKMRHIGGFDLASPNGNQNSVDSFLTFDAFFSYAFKAEDGWKEDLTLNLNIGNILDEDPPFFNSRPGYTNGSTLGRHIQVGFSKKI